MSDLEVRNAMIAMARVSVDRNREFGIREFRKVLSVASKEGFEAGELSAMLQPEGYLRDAGIDLTKLRFSNAALAEASKLAKKHGLTMMPTLAPQPTDPSRAAAVTDNYGQVEAALAQGQREGFYK